MAKPRRWLNGLLVRALAGLMLVATPTMAAFGQSTDAGAGRAADTVMIWFEAQTGLAIGGFDPVAYHVDRSARRGRDVHEYAWAGATWRFVSEANMAVFVADPDVYAPRFGGYDPLQLARGYLAAGNPHIWAIVDDRLYLFRSSGHRSGWMKADFETHKAASRAWPELYLRTQ